MDTTSAVVAIVVTAMVVGIPLFGLTLRLAIRPLIEAWIRLREGPSASASSEVEALKVRVAALEAVLESQGMFQLPSEHRGLEQRPMAGRLLDKS